MANPIERKSSFEIADSYVEFNFRPIIEAEKIENMSKTELRHNRKQQKKQKDNQKHYLRNSLYTGFGLAVVVILVGFLWWNNATSPVNRADKDIRQFVVDKGTTNAQVADALVRAGFIKSTLAFRIYTHLHPSTIQAGVHMLSASYDIKKIVSHLSLADADEVNVQIPPGVTINELKSILKKYDYTDEQIEKALSANYDNEILADRPDASSLEGYIFPDTYRVMGADTPSVIIGKSIKQLASMDKKYNLKSKFAERGLSFYQGITLASIVTKEVSNEADQKMVAGVFYNRLNGGMNIGSDVTYMYAYKMGYCAVNTPNDCDSAYNTRIHGGLPPGPIANPSLSALLAVAEPTESDNLYFVAGEDGKTYFSKTADEHNRAVADHCGSLCE